MRLILDTNRIISALIKEGLSRVIVASPNIEFYTLDYVLEEVKKYKKLIMKKSRMGEEEMELLFTLFMQKIVILSDEEVEEKMEEAIAIMKDIDINDSPILACALAIPNEGIWTEDKHFEKQNKAKVWKNKDLIKFM